MRDSGVASRRYAVTAGPICPIIRPGALPGRRSSRESGGRVNQAERIKALELEFERLKQRADYIDRVLQGDPDVWVHINEILPQHIGSIELDKPVAEGRQTALAMATVLKTLASLGEEAPDKPEEDPLRAIQKKAEDELAARRATKPA